MTRGSLPRVPFANMKDAVLGTEYELSLVFAGSTRSQALNKAHRGKSYVPNILSFPLSPRAGEIFITPSVVKREAAREGVSFSSYLGFIFIHGLLHLKGLPHGSTMDKREQALCKRFGIAYPYRTRKHIARSR